jgi:hypothetical protein
MCCICLPAFAGLIDELRVPPPTLTVSSPFFLRLIIEVLKRGGKEGIEIPISVRMSVSDLDLGAVIQRDENTFEAAVNDKQCKTIRPERRSPKPLIVLYTHLL